MKTPTSSIICLMGPTAAGKTDLAIAISQHLPCEIISVDSAMVYRGMNIGSAKPSPDMLQKYPHRLLDIRDPSETYSAGQFVVDANQAINDILHQGKIPLLVGGTMLYFRALQKGIAELPTADANVRAKLSQEAAELGWQVLHQRLQQIDPVAAKRIHPNDPQRLQRALEVYELTGKTLTELHIPIPNTASIPDYRVINLAVAPSDRQVLHENIAKRFNAMLDQGFIDEVRQLYERGDLNAELPAIRAVGYRQVWDYLAGKLTFEQMQQRGIIATRQLAKRQLTWLRSWENLQWFDSLDKDCLNKILQFLSEVMRNIDF